jgi:hypothetical protein
VHTNGKGTVHTYIRGEDLERNSACINNSKETMNAQQEKKRFCIILEEQCIYIYLERNRAHAISEEDHIHNRAGLIQNTTRKEQCL